MPQTLHVKTEKENKSILGSWNTFLNFMGEMLFRAFESKASFTKASAFCPSLRQ